MDLPSILVPYGLPDLVVHSPRLAPIGNYMKCMGHLFRHFNDSQPDYDDSFVLKFVTDRGEDLSYYDGFDVVPQVKEHARKALARYDRIEDPFTDDVKQFYDIAGHWLELEFGSYLQDSKIVSNDYVEQHLRDDKSPGAPWNMVGIRTKGEFFEQKPEFYVTYWDKLATADHIRSLSSSSIKEELRDAEKVRNGQVRTIISMDVAHVKAHCQLALDQNMRLMYSCGKHSSCLGIVMQYGGWNQLNERMSAFGPLPCTLELDARQFDSRYRYYCFCLVRNFRFKMLAREFQTEANWIRLSNLYWELCFSPLVDVDGNVFSRECGNPSGQACTTPDNIFKNFMDIVVIWHLIMPESYHNYRDFHRFLILCIVGDDINISVHPAIQHLFNAKRIFDVMGQLDMEYTTPCMSFRHNYNCEFLSHGFEEMLGIYVPVIDCKKMRTSMLKFNVSGEIWETIARACGLRSETFGCIHCREWFSDLIKELKRAHGYSTDPKVIEAWKSYKTDAELWSLYTGLKYSDVCTALASAARSPEYKFAQSNNLFTRYTQSYRSPSMSSLLKVAISKPPSRSAKKPKTKKKKMNNPVPHAPGKRKRYKKKGRLDRKKVEVITRLANREISLEDAQALYCHAANNAFTVRMPPISHSRTTIVPFNAAHVSITNNLISYQLYVYRPSVKAMVYKYLAATNATAWGVATALDANALTTVATNFDEIRVGLGALAIDVFVTSDVLQPIIYTGTLPASSMDIGTLTPDAMFKLNYEKVPGLKAYCAWAPYDNVNMHFNNVAQNIGPYSADSVHWIMVYSMDVTANKGRVSVGAVSQCEGLPSATAAATFPAADVESKHASWSVGETVETVSDFIWKGYSTWSNSPPAIKTAVGQFVLNSLSNANHPANRLMRGSVGDTFVTVVYQGAFSEFGYINLDKIFGDRNLSRLFRDEVSEADYTKVLAFMAERPQPPPIKHWADESDHEDEKHGHSQPVLSNSTMDLAQALRGLVNRNA